jgi:hypothetical protein
MYHVFMGRTMAEGGRNLEGEILETFFEEVDRDDDIPEHVGRELRSLEENDKLTDSQQIVEATRDGLDQCTSTE